MHSRYKLFFFMGSNVNLALFLPFTADAFFLQHIIEHNWIPFKHLNLLPFISIILTF